MVEVFKTNIQFKSKRNDVVMYLQFKLPHYHINFDPEDRDKILRVEAEQLQPEEVMKLVNEKGYNCEILL